MFCVSCGTMLNDSNQEGIVCLQCKKMHRERKTMHNDLLQVHFCYNCGAPYEPVDQSIQHCYSRYEEKV